jgi:orotate phosphoribosyltransferase
MDTDAKIEEVQVKPVALSDAAITAVYERTYATYNWVGIEKALVPGVFDPGVIDVSGPPPGQTVANKGPLLATLQGVGEVKTKAACLLMAGDIILGDWGARLYVAGRAPTEKHDEAVIKVSPTPTCDVLYTRTYKRDERVPVRARVGDGEGEHIDIDSPGYMDPLFHPQKFRKVIDAYKLYLQEHPEVTSIAGCGFSSVPLAAALSAETGRPMTIVRKKDDNLHKEHGGRQVTGYTGAGQYIIVEDTVASGRTVNHIIDEISEAAPDLKLKAILLYCEEWERRHVRQDGEYPIIPVIWK